VSQVSEEDDVRLWLAESEEADELEAIALLRWLHAESEWKRERERSSRQAWAEEALRLQMAVDKVLETYDGPATRLLRVLSDKQIAADTASDSNAASPRPQCTVHPEGGGA
jgi:hypothetical protein